MKAVDILIDTAKERRKYFADYLKYARIIKAEAKNILGDKELKIIIFGSVTDETHSVLSDIDLLLVSERLPRDGLKRARICVKLDELLGRKNPFEIHLATEAQFNNWYKKFLKRYIEV